MSILETTGAIDTSRERTPAPLQVIEPGGRVDEQGSTDEQNEDSLSRGESITRDRNCWDPFNTKRFLYFCLGTSSAIAIAFITLYSRSFFRQTGGEVLPTPVVLKISVKNYTEDNFFNRMYISGKDTTIEENKKSETVDIRWRTNRGTDQNDFWYLEVSPIRESGKDCPVSRDGTFGFFDEVDSFNNDSTSSCNLYDFRLVIFNNLTGEFSHGATVHFHGLTPPSNQDGVPFISNANIHPQNLQAYRFNQFTYPGLHWMHAHTGFQQAYGVAAPIILQHSKLYFDKNGFKTKDDLVVMLEEGFLYPKCAYSTDWYSKECHEIAKSTNSSFFGKLVLFINRREKPLVYSPDDSVKKMRIRFLNGGSEAPWRITNSYAEENNGTKVNMEIIATDGHDVIRGKKRDEFVLGLANRIDVLLDLSKARGNEDILITAVQMKHSGNVTNPALRHIVIRTRRNADDDGKQLIVANLPNYDKKKNSTILTNFNLFEDLTAAHPLSERKIMKAYTIENRGGDQFGGFPLTVYEGLVDNGSSPSLSNLTVLTPANTYTELNKLKFQLPPYKVFRNKNTKETISTRRKCHNCTQGSFNRSGIRERPNANEPYNIIYDSSNVEGDNICCWEWCDVPEKNCEDYELEYVDTYEPNKNFIPVCFGDRVRFLFINTASFEDHEGHPMHLHGHDFVLRELYDVKQAGIGGEYELVLNTNYTYDISGPKLDTIWVPFNQAVAFDFDAYNAGEHLFHCHNDFHLENGMMTTVRYMHDDSCMDLPEFVGGESDYPKQICTMDDCTPPP